MRPSARRNPPALSPSGREPHPASARAARTTKWRRLEGPIPLVVQGFVFGSILSFTFQPFAEDRVQIEPTGSMSVIAKV